MNKNKLNKIYFRKFMRRNKIYLEGVNFIKRGKTEKGTEIIKFFKDDKIIAEILDPNDQRILINYS